MPRISAPPPPIPKLYPTLASLGVEKLKWYASILPGRAPSRKPELVEHIADTLTNPEIVKRIVANLTRSQQRALGEIAHRYNGRFDELAISAKYPGVSIQKTGSERYSYSLGYGASKQTAAPRPFDLFFYYNYTLDWYIPSDLSEILQLITNPEPPMKIGSKQEIPILEYRDRTSGQKMGIEQFESRAEESVFTDLAATLSLVEDGKVSIGVSTHLPSLPTVRALRNQLLVADLFTDKEYARSEDAMRTQALVVIVQAAHWASSPGGGSKLQLTRAGSDVLAREIGAPQVREAWARWVKSNLLDELSRVGNIKGQQSNATRLNKPALRHEAIEQALRVLPVEKWVEIDEFTRYIRGENVLPEIELSHPTGLYVGSSYYGGLYEKRQYWDIVIGSYVRAVIMEYVASLGMVEIAYTKPEYGTRTFDEQTGSDFSDYDYISRYDGLIALKLTPLGAYVLGLSGSYVEAERPKGSAGKIEMVPVLRVLPTLDIVILDASRLMPHEKMLLERVAAVQSDHVYRLSRDVMLESIGKVVKLDAVKSFLAEKSGIAPEGLPNTVLTFFDDVERRSTILREGERLIVFESDDPYLLAELSKAPGIRGVAQLGKIGAQDVLFVPESHEREARKQIKKLGYAAQKKIT
ncbi:MAG: hypothetical protein ABIQ44_15205 [Chloroflexia bacterium]